MIKFTEILILGRFWMKKNWFTKLFWFKCELPSRGEEAEKLYWARTKCQK
jgi:hypothetical protein